MTAKIWASFREVRLLRRAEEVPRTSVRRIAAAEGIGVPLVWRIAHEQSLYPYHFQRVQALTPPDHRARVVFCLWLLAKCLINTQFVAYILFTDEAGFTRECIVSFHHAHVWVDDNPHTTVAARHQHRFSANIWMGILGDELFRTRCHTLTYQVQCTTVSLVYSPKVGVLVNDLPYSWGTCLFINDNKCGSYMVGHHLIFSALTDNT
jgi:hypothetical protein